MIDVLIPIGLLLFIVTFAFALIYTARKQRKAKSSVFKDFAVQNGLCHRYEDDGKAQRFAMDFDGVGRFKSASAGKIIPKDVVSGTINGLPVILFRHSIRFSEGWAREWFVAGLTNPEPVAERCAVQFCRKTSDKRTMYIQDKLLKEMKVGSFDMVVRAAALSAAGKMADDRILKQMADLAGDLSFRPEIQVRGNRIMGYPADRNETVEDTAGLRDLLAFTKNVAGL
jgi:hypothetical protein